MDKIWLRNPSKSNANFFIFLKSVLSWAKIVIGLIGTLWLCWRKILKFESGYNWNPRSRSLRQSIRFAWTLTSDVNKTIPSVTHRLCSCIGEPSGDGFQNHFIKLKFNPNIPAKLYTFQNVKSRIYIWPMNLHTHSCILNFGQQLLGFTSVLNPWLWSPAQSNFVWNIFNVSTSIQPWRAHIHPHNWKGINRCYV